MRLTTVVILIVLCALPVMADELFTEVGAVGTIIAQNVELSLLGGTVGWGAGAFWPLYEIEQVQTTIGPFIAFGNKLVAAGLGAKLPVQLPLLENYVDFIAAGGAYKHNSLTFEVWVGKTIPLQ